MTKKTKFAAACLAMLAGQALAADYYVVVPSKGKRASAPVILATLNPITLPNGVVTVGYSYDFKPLLLVTGDPSFALGSAAFALASTPPAGVTLSESGVLAGTPTGSFNGAISVRVTYRGVQAQQDYPLILAAANSAGQLTADSGTTFGPVALNVESSNVFTFTNTGNVPLTGLYSQVGSGSGFTLVTAGCGTSTARATLQPGDSCKTTVRFNHANPGSYSAPLNVYSSAPNSPSALTLSGTAQGVTATLTAGTPLMALGSVGVGATAPTGSWTFRNDGNVAMTLTPSGLTAPFSVVNNSCTTVQAGETCALTVGMATTSAAPNSSRAITITGASVPLTGYSVSGAVTAANSINIVSATYGGNGGAPTGNRTTYIAGLCNGLQGSCTILGGTLFTQAAGGDPVRGKTKDFSVTFTCGGLAQPTYYRAPEAGLVSNTISCP